MQADNTVCYMTPLLLAANAASCQCCKLPMMKAAYLTHSAHQFFMKSLKLLVVMHLYSL